MPSSFSVPEPLKPELIQFLDHTLKSYLKWTQQEWKVLGEPQSKEWLESILHSPKVLVSHDTKEDPIFNFGNNRALNLFEMPFEDFTQLPSRKSAETMLREEREELIQRVREFGYTDSYQGIRISSSGQRFHIPQATVWNVINDDGDYIGQAATFDQWTFLSE